MLTVEVASGVVRIAVRDGSPVRPRIHSFAATSADRPGLRLLDRLAKRWGVDAVRRTGGKVVWFEVGRGLGERVGRGTAYGAGCAWRVD